MYSFSCFGHSNITSKHKNTFEFTKDDEIGKVADCIVGVKADYDLGELKEFLKGKDKIKIRITAGGLIEEVNCGVNPNFDDEREIVVRRSDFSSKRTLGLRADKVSKDFSRQFVSKLKEGKIQVKIF
ncbi:MAG: DUF371 domain-containing protein [Nanoarchaeota archaeon]|nr:DUF371 domain-containing protein [Nanoarchaeota archaeon]MBU1704424.1 DUF371 domain-containing protein [Nanoarchaeota archaeon]